MFGTIQKNININIIQIGTRYLFSLSITFAVASLTCFLNFPHFLPKKCTNKQMLQGLKILSVIGAKYKEIS